MKLGKTLAALTALVAVSVTTIAAPAQTIINKDKAVALALEMMPRGAEHLSTNYDEDDKEYEVKFHSGGTKEKFEVNVDAVLGAVEDLESETYIEFDKNAKNKVKKNNKYKPNYSKQQIIELVKKAYKGAVVTEVELEEDNGYWIYEVEFKADKVEGSLEMDPETGRTLERDLAFKLVGAKPDVPTTLPSDEIVEGVFTETQAIQTVYNKLPKGTNFVGSKRVVDDNKVSYEVTFTYQTYHIEATVDSADGSIDEVDVFCMKEIDKNAPNSYENGRYVAKYSPDQVEKIVLKQFPTGKVVKVQMGLSRNMWVYDIDVNLKNGDIDVLVCPETGRILAIDMDVESTNTPLIPLEPSIPVKPEENKILTEAQVRDLIKKLVPNGTIIKLELDEDDDEWVYEVEVVSKNHEYEIEIDAKTGKTLEFEKEKLNDDDDYKHDDKHDGKDDDDDDDDDERDND